MKAEPEDPGLPRHRRGRTIRRVSVAVVVVFVFAGATSFLGVQTRTANAPTSSDYFLSVDYGSITRAGLNTPLRVHVSHAGGFPGPVTLGITQAYMSLFDLNGFYPNPSSMTVADGTLLLEFERPKGNEFTFTLDARLGPSVQRGKSAHISVIEDGVEVNAVDITTRVVP